MAAIASPIRFLGRRPSRRAALVAAALALVAAAGVLVWARGGEPAVRTVAGASGAFQLSYPAGWEPATPQQLLAHVARPDALLRRADGLGVVVVHERPRLDGSLAALERNLDRQLERRMPDAKPVASRVVQLPTGPALSYTFVRERAGLVQGIVAAPSAGRTLMLETAARGDAADVAREIGAIVRSLSPGS